MNVNWSGLAGDPGSVQFLDDQELAGGSSAQRITIARRIR
jgi:hypothetical protein